MSTAKEKLGGFWFDGEGKCIATAAAEGGARRGLKAPFDGPGVLYLKVEMSAE